MREDLTVAQVASIVGCHFNTVKNYTKRGYIEAARDINGFRRYSVQQALKLREILAIRKKETE